MNYKNLLIALVALMCITSCRKSSSNAKIVNNNLVLATPVLTNNKIKLTWTKVQNDSLYQYVIVRIVDSTVSPVATIQTIVDTGAAGFIDSPGLHLYTQYYIRADLAAHGIVQRSISSNKQITSRPDIIPLEFSDAVYDYNSHYLYLTSLAGDVAKYDVQGKTLLKQISIQKNVEGFAIGNYQGKTELYLGGWDGQIYIYDAETLGQIDHINVGSEIREMVYNNGIFFLITNPTSSIQSYSRATKSKLSASNYYYSIGIKYVPGSNSELFGILPPYVDHYKFDNLGNYLSDKHDTLTGVNLEPTIFESYPDGSNFITSPDGVIISKNLTYVNSLPHGSNSFTSFAFDPVNRLIYSGCSNTNTIFAYSMDNYQLMKTIPTQWLVRRLFFDNGVVVSVSPLMGSSGSSGIAGRSTLIELH